MATPRVAPKPPGLKQDDGGHGMSARGRRLKAVPKQEPVRDLEEINRKLRVLAMALQGLAVDCGGFGSPFVADGAELRRSVEILAVDLQVLERDLLKAVAS